MSATATPSPSRTQEAAERILVYDGDCSMCVRLSKPATWRWLVGRATRRPFAAFEGDEAARLMDAGVNNELAVIDRASGEIRSGYDGLVWLLEGGLLRWLVPLLRLGPVRWFLRHDYRLVAYNRRIFAPPARGVSCACDPDLHVGYRVRFIAVALLWTGLFAALGAAFFWTRGAFWPVSPERIGSAGLAGVAALAGWCTAGLAGLWLPRERRLDHLGHLAWIFAAMVVPLILAAALALGGLLLGSAGGPAAEAEGWLQEPGAARRVGTLAWGLALPIALFAGLRRLPLLGFAKRSALLIALVSWLLPTALLYWMLPLPIHGT